MICTARHILFRRWN